MMRSTIHAVSASDYWPLMIATSEARRQWFLRVYRGPLQRGRLRRRGRDRAEPARVRPQAQVRARRRGRPGPLGRGRHVPRHGPGAAVGDLGAAAGRSLRIGRRVDPTDRDNEEPAIEWLIKRYLGGFGPAARDRHRYLGGDADGSDHPDSRTDGSPSLSSPKTARILLDLKRMPLPDRRRPCPGAFPAGVGRDPPGPRPAEGGDRRGPPSDHLQHQDSRSRCRPSWSTGRWQEPGDTKATGVKLTPFDVDPEKMETRAGGGSRGSGGVPRLSGAEVVSGWRSA